MREEKEGKMKSRLEDYIIKFGNDDDWMTLNGTNARVKFISKEMNNLLLQMMSITYI